MVLREPNDPLNQSRGIMGPLENSAVQNNKGRLRQRFDLIRKLGQGTYGKVQLGIDKETGQEVAIKTIKKSKIETEADLIRIRREIQIMSSVRHPNIIHIYEVFENREKMVLVMEYAAGGELYDYLNERKILQEDEARRIFRQIASAVYYCHKNCICHRDLKLENILLDEKANAKIADFGLSNVFDDVNLLKTFCGSPLYASPEIVRGTPYYGPEVDCWSLGVLLYTLVYGAMPFDGSNFKRLVKQISNGDYYEPKKPAEASLLIRRMLTVDPLKRASIKDVCSHQWINQGFDTPCLANAEELANQTPVRLDLLLSVAPAYNINHSQVVIACDQTPQDQSQIDSEIPSTSAGAKPSTKAKKEKDLATGSTSKNAEHQKGAAGGAGAVAPFDKPARSTKVRPPESIVPVKAQKEQKEVKKKPVAKMKSKSSPVLELIVDVEEEEPLECIDGAGEDDDDAADTLSEISEIQTIAEDVKEVIKSKSKLVKEEPPLKVQQQQPQPEVKKEVVKEIDKDKEKKKPIVQDKVKSKESTEKEPEKEKTVETSATSATNKKIVPTVVAATPKAVTSTTSTTPQTPAVESKDDDKPKTDTVKVKAKPTKIQDKPKEEIIPAKVTVDVESKEKTLVVEPPSVPVTPTTTTKPKEEVKKEKVKMEEESKEKSAPAPPVASEGATETTPTKPPTVVKKKLVKKSVKATTDADGGDKTKAGLASSSSSIASSGGERSGTKLDKESSKATPKLRARSDSNSSDASPTRIERRSSKVISQKTAELIQNLETKTSTSSTDSGKNKKLVFPSLKVSDAKRAFEKPPKPVTAPLKPVAKTTTTTTKGDAKPKAETKVEKEKEKEKVEGTELTVKTNKKSKSKSPSPCPDSEKNKKVTKVDGEEEKETEIKTVSKKSQNIPIKKLDQEPPSETVTPTPVVETKENVEKEKIVPPVDKTKVNNVVVKEKEQKEDETVKVELKVEPSPVKQESVSPKPEKKSVTTNSKPQVIAIDSALIKPLSPVPAAIKTVMSPEPPMSPEPDTETTQTVSDDLNTEIDNTEMSMSEFSVSEIPKSTTVGSSKPVKKLKLKINVDNHTTSDQLVKPVMVDSGHGPPRQAIMLMSGKTTPPVKSSHDYDSASISTDPFFSQSESISMTLPKDKVSTTKKVIPQNKEQAVKKISAVISRIASSESNERLLNEDKGKGKFASGNKIIKTEVEKFVQAPEKVYKTQRSEISFPVAAAQSQERIIPIKFAEDIVSPSTPPIQGQAHANVLSSSSKTQSAPNISRTIPTKKIDASSSSVFSRQNSSDTESSIAPTPKPEPIRKSPREFIIPIKIETSGQTVTPKEDIAEASSAEDPFRMDSRLRSGRFGRHKRYSSLLSDSSLEEEPTASISASTSRRSSTTTAPSHARSHSLGDETEPTTPLGTFKRYKMRRSGGGAPPLDRSDSFSSAEEDEEDAFEVLTAESLFSNLLDRVRNLTKRLNRDDGPSQNWPGPESPGFGLWGTSNPFFRAPSETRYVAGSGGPGSYTMTRSFSREPSVTVTISTGGKSDFGDSDSASVGPDSSAPSRSGSVFQSRGSFGSGDNAMETCTVRSLPMNLGSSRRSQFLNRTEPRGPDKFGRSVSCFNGQDESRDGGSLLSPLSTTSSAYNPPTPRPYGRTMSNSEYSTSVTLPFRRSLKSSDRPGGYNFQNDYSSSSSPVRDVPDHYLSSSGTTPHYALPHRSNSVISSSPSRYGSSAGVYGTNSYGSNLTSDSQLNSPYSNRYSRSLSRPRATPEPDIPSRFTRDVSTPRQLDNVSGGNSTRSGESNGNWVGGVSSSSLKTSAAASAKMTTQEKMNNYQNYYESLSQHPTRRLHVPVQSPALANYDDNNYNACNGFHDDFMFRQSVDRAGSTVPRNSPMYQGYSNVTNFSPHRFENRQRFLGQATNNNSTPIGMTPPILASRELSSPPMLHQSSQSRETTPGFTNNIVGSTSATSSNCSNSPSISKCWPNVTVKTHRPVNIANLNSTNLISSPPPPPPSTSSHVPNSFIRMTSPQPPPLVSPPLMAERAVSTDRESLNFQPQQQQPLKRDTRASADKITCFLQRKSMSRDLVSPPPLQGYIATTSPPSTSSTPTIETKSMNNSESPSLPPLQQPKNVPQQQQQQQNQDEDQTDRNSNASPDKIKSISMNQKTTSKPKFIQSLEKKWEKLTTGTSASNSASNILSLKGNEEIGRKDKVSPINLNETNREQNDDDDTSLMGKVDSESSLLQRAVSPEKKPKSKFGSSTVNFMLGKFRRFEENSSSSGVGGIVSKIPSNSTKPPSSGISSSNSSRIGRRVQSVYAGASSDSVLTLSSHLGRGSTPCNGQEIEPSDISSKPPLMTTPGQGLIRKPQPIYPSSSSVQIQDVPSIPQPTPISTTTRTEVEVQGEESETGEDCKMKSMTKLRRPLSLGIFSNNNSTTSPSQSNPVTSVTTSSSFIPRFTRQNVAAVAAAAEAENCGLKFPENVITTVSQNTPLTTPPQINVTDCKVPTDEVDDTNPLTPTSISDSFDSSSVCSEKTEMSYRSGGLDESVSDRILRKSFYPRFNSLDRPLDRKNRSNSVTSSSPRHYSPKPSSTSGGNLTSSLSSGKKIQRSSLSPSHGDSSLNTNNGLGNFHSNLPSGSSGNDNETSSVSSKITINKYSPNPLFKELITDEFKSDVGRKAEYSRRVTSKLSKLLREIESDIGNRSGGSGTPKKEKECPTSSQLRSSNRCRDALSPSPVKQNNDHQSNVN